MRTVDYSWIFPVFNEASSLPQLINEIKNVMTGKNWEIIAVDDASADNTLTTLKSLTPQIPQLKIIHLSSHQGKWAALFEGFQQARGKIVISLDSDLQDDPSQVKKLLPKLNQGYDLISGWRRVRRDPLYKVIISKLGNWLASKLTSHNFRDLNSPFKVYRRIVLEDMPKQGSLLRFTMLFAEKVGYRVVEVPVVHRPRLYGQSNFGIVKYLRIIYDLILVLLLFSGSGKLSRINKKLF